MSHDDRHKTSFTDGRTAGSDGQAARSEAGAEGRLAASRPGLGGLWVLLVPLACCGGPLLIAILAAAGALAWGALGVAAGVLVAVTVLVLRHRRSSRACREAGMTGWAQDSETVASRRPIAR